MRVHAAMSAAPGLEPRTAMARPQPPSLGPARIPSTSLSPIPWLRSRALRLPTTRLGYSGRFRRHEVDNTKEKLSFADGWIDDLRFANDTAESGPSLGVGRRVGRSRWPNSATPGYAPICRIGMPIMLATIKAVRDASVRFRHRIKRPIDLRRTERGRTHSAPPRQRGRVTGAPTAEQNDQETRDALLNEFQKVISTVVRERDVTPWVAIDACESLTMRCLTEILDRHSSGDDRQS